MYCRLEDIYNAKEIKYLLSTSNDIDNPSTADNAIIQALINNCSDFINDYIRVRYDLPLLNTHSTLKQVCIDLVVYELLKRKTIPNNDELFLYKNAIDILEKIRSGKILLNEGNDIDATQSNKSTFSITKNESIFNGTIDKFKKRFEI